MMDLLALLRGQMGQEETPIGPTVPVSNVSNYVQEQLGAKPASNGGFVENILGGRFQTGGGPSFGDYGQQIAAAAGGKIASPQAFADERLNSTFNTMAQMTKLQQSSQGVLPKGYRFAADGTAELIPGIDAGALNSNSTGGATGALVQRLMDTTGMPFDQALYAVQTGMRQGTNYQNGQVNVLPGAPQAKGALKGGEVSGGKTAEQEVERKAGYTKAQSALKGFEQKTKLVTDTIDKALATAQNSNFATGYGSVLTSSLPNSAAGKLQNYIRTIQANVGFDQLQQMRDNSPTGGALGNVSDSENRLLAATQGALDPTQSDQLVENLKIIKQYYPIVLEEKRRAFEQDYGNVQPIGNNPVPSAGVNNISENPVYQQARDAIARGADAEAVAQRLQQQGYDPGGL